MCKLLLKFVRTERISKDLKYHSPFFRRQPLAMKCLYVVALMAMFWVTEVLPLPVTGMIPVVLYPLMGIMSTNETCLCYMNDTTMMFLGSLVIAVVIENSGLHMRVALLIIKTVGCSHRRYFSLIKSCGNCLVSQAHS